MSKFYDDIARGCLPTGEPLENLYGVGWWTEEDEPEPEPDPAELEAEQRWIPVSEPPTVYRDGHSEFIPFLVCTPESRLPFRAVYDGDEWGDGWNIIHVTHWMPLPQPPEERER